MVYEAMGYAHAAGVHRAAQLKSGSEARAARGRSSTSA